MNYVNSLYFFSRRLPTKKDPRQNTGVENTYTHIRLTRHYCLFT